MVFFALRGVLLNCDGYLNTFPHDWHVLSMFVTVLFSFVTGLLGL